MGERPMYRQGDVLLDGVGRLPPGVDGPLGAG